MKKFIILTGVLFFLTFQSIIAQGFPEKAILKKLKGDAIIMDDINEDGVFKIRHKKTKKWGMYQWIYDGVKTTEIIPIQYDSINLFPSNGLYTSVYNDGKVGFFLSYWSFNENTKESIPCIYDEYQRANISGVQYLAVRKGDKWAWIDWYNGEEKTDFEFDSFEDLPYPDKLVSSYYGKR